CVASLRDRPLDGVGGWLRSFLEETRSEVMSADPGPIRILSVDDHPVLRQGVAALVGGQADMSLVGEASNGREAIQQFRLHHPDVTLMDLQMPEMNGLDAIIAIRGEFPEARVILLTTYAGDVQVLRALKAGARGSLLKKRLPRNSPSAKKPSRAKSETSSPNWTPMIGPTPR